MTGMTRLGRAPRLKLPRAAWLLRLTAATFLKLKQQQDHKENLVRGLTFFGTFSDDQITMLASGMRPRTFEDGAVIYAHGAPGRKLIVEFAVDSLAKLRVHEAHRRQI